MHRFRFHFHFGFGVDLPRRDAGWAGFRPCHRRRRRRTGTPFWLSGKEKLPLPRHVLLTVHCAHPLASFMKGSCVEVLVPGQPPHLCSAKAT